MWGRRIMFAKLALVALGLALAIPARIVQAQDRPEIGRFQVVIPINGEAAAILVDTITGRSWILSGKKDRRWSELNFGEMKGGHPMLTPPPCTQDNPTCFFEAPKAKPAEGEAVH